MKKSKPKGRHNPTPIVIPADDLTPSDLGMGYRLSFQRSTKDIKQVRAVIKDPEGMVIFSGKVTDESNALASRMEVLYLMKEATKALLKKATEMFGGTLPPGWKK